MQPIIISLQWFLEVKICSQLLLILIVTEIGSIRQHGKDNPYKLMRGCKEASLKDNPSALLFK